MTRAITLTLEDARLIGARLTRIHGPMSLEEYQALERLADQLDAADAHRAIFPAPLIIGPSGEEHLLSYEQRTELGEQNCGRSPQSPEGDHRHSRAQPLERA